ncbi:MAG: proteasome subunit beta [Acidimicrobiaceae bacterium]|nr:proteasome subunit beta [Acidimicrobiaceae bacterium]
MGLPLFDAVSDPGPSFVAYAESARLTPLPVTAPDAVHATTVVALKCESGVVMVGDRQATSSYIASRDVRKIEAADRFTAVSISGSAARGMEFIRLAQLSFEHYEKMSDASLSLEGKANYLSPLIQRNNLTTPLVVLPLLAGWDSAHRVGRVFEYDGAGGCYERQDFAVIGSGTPFAEGALRLGFRPQMSLDEAVELGALAIYEAGDNDPSTGGPDFVRGIYPMIVTVTEDGYREFETPACADVFQRIHDRRRESGGVAGGTLR